LIELIPILTAEEEARAETAAVVAAEGDVAEGGVAEAAPAAIAVTVPEEMGMIPS
jgi:hypothetical protein